MSLNTIHVNSSTKITLNDRFTMIQNPPSSTTPAKRVQSPRRNRRNSQSGGGVREMTPKGSYRNRQLIDQLEKRHKIVAAMKLKKKSIRTNMTFRQKNKMNWKNAGKAISISPGGKLRRTNSLTNLATMKADTFTGPGTRLKRSNSASNLAGRLGRRGGGARGRINRSNSFSNLKRSGSKQNLTRSNSRTNLSRANSQTNLNRSNSQTRLNYNNNNNNNNNGNPQRRKLNRSNFRQRSNSVNSRLGVNRTNVPNAIGGKRGRGRVTRGTNIVRGRIFRRSAATGNTVNAIGTGNQQGRLGRSRIRGQIGVRGQTRFRGGQQTRGQAPVRGQSANRGRSRSRSRSRANLVVKNSTARPQGNNGRGRGSGRGRGRGGISGSGGRVAQPVKSKEELDQELEQYMANTKSHLDKEMDEYMKDVTY